jgi:hypothetical protein
VKEFTVSRSLFDRPRKLILATDCLEYEDKDLKGNEFTRFEKSDILDFKHGTNWIVWYEFTVGLTFAIAIKNRHRKEIKISFDSYFGRRRRNYTMYSDIISTIKQYYHSDIIDGYLDRFYNGQDVDLQGIILTKSGVFLKGKQSVLPWGKVGIKDYQNYFAVYNNDQPEVNTRIETNQYESETLWCTLRIILNEKNEK